jgi:two-component sensor histidine kinase
MNPASLLLSSNSLDHLIPFHLQWDERGQLTGLSSRLRRYWAIDPARSIEGLDVQIARPFRGPIQPRFFNELTGMALDVCLGGCTRVLRGEVLPLEAGQGWLVVGVPLISTVSGLQSSGLLLGDLPAHLGLGDLLIANEAVMLAQQASEEATREIELRSQRLAASLREKETLLAEVHHRVKNNLQIIASLLSMQSQSLPEPSLRVPLEESILRVRAMALIHELLYGMESLAEVDLAAYALQLSETLRSSLAPRARVAVVAESLAVSAQLAMSVGLVLNELLTNALKYGMPTTFDADPEPELTVTIVRSADAFSLTVRDRGPGLPAGVDPLRSAGLGLSVVRSLARQLRARFSFERPPRGLAFTLTVPLSGD